MPLPRTVGSLNLRWKRPQIPKSPKIWSTFSAKKRNSYKMEEFRTQDLPESRYDDGIDFLTKHYLRNEPLCQAFELANDGQATKDYQSMWRLVLRQNMAIACFKTGSDEIIAVNATYVRHKDDHVMISQLFESFESINMLDFINICMAFSAFTGNFNVFEHYELDEYLSCEGVAVHTNYYGFGFFEQFLLSRMKICKEFGLKLTAGDFTSDHSYRVGEKLGFKTDHELRYDDLRSLYPHVRLPHINSDALRHMSKLV